MEIIRKHDAHEDVVLSSFNPLVLYRLKRLDPRVRTALIFMDTNWNPELIAEIRPEDLVNLPWPLRQEFVRRAVRKIVRPDLLSINHEVDPAVIDRLIAKGWPAFIWTIDEEPDLRGRARPAALRRHLGPAVARAAGARRVNAAGGFAIHDPDVVLTDLALALLGAYLGWRLWTAPDRGRMTRTGVVIMGALASAAFWGAMFHAFFPAGTATRAGFMAWVPVVLSILVVAAALLELALRVVGARACRRRPATRSWRRTPPSLPRWRCWSTRRSRRIVRFYAPVVFLFLLVAGWQAVRTPQRGLDPDRRLLRDLPAGRGAAAGPGLDPPEHFDHNAVYHVLQGVALVLLYRGFLRAEAP